MLDDFMLSSNFAPTTNRPMILHAMLHTYLTHMSKGVSMDWAGTHCASIVVASRPVPDEEDSVLWPQYKRKY